MSGSSVLGDGSKATRCAYWDPSTEERCAEIRGLRGPLARGRPFICPQHLSTAKKVNAVDLKNFRSALLSGTFESVENCSVHEAGLVMANVSWLEKDPLRGEPFIWLLEDGKDQRLPGIHALVQLSLPQVLCGLTTVMLALSQLSGRHANLPLLLCMQKLIVIEKDPASEPDRAPDNPAPGRSKPNFSLSHPIPCSASVMWLLQPLGEFSHAQLFEAVLTSLLSAIPHADLPILTGFASSHGLGLHQLADAALEV